MDTTGFAGPGVRGIRPTDAITRLAGVLLLAGVMVLASGCCRQPAVAPFVAVREKNLRTDELSLPLDEAARNDLLIFLEYGGDRRAMESGMDPVYLDVKERYLPLLELLSSDPALDTQDLTNGTYARWFSGEPNDQVIDASKDDPPLAERRLAVSDGRFWFVFTLDGGYARLASLVAFPATREPVEAKP